MRLNKLIILGVILVLVVLRMCLFTVDRTEFVYVTQLGRHVATYDGSHDEQAGLHLRYVWPVQTLTRIDRRLQVLELPAAELVTEDPSEGGSIDKTLAIDAYVVWRIPDAAACERFILTVGTVEHAREILRDRFRGKLGAVIARTRFGDLISADPGRVDEKREELRRQLLSAKSSDSPEDGIEIVDVRIRRLNYPAQVRQEIFQRIISERSRKATVYRSRGETEAANIRSASAAKISVDEAAAQARNDEKRGAAEGEADRILNRAISKDPAYYAELKRREIGVLSLDSKKKVWSTTLFKLFFPALPAGEGMKPPKEGRR